MTVPPGSPSAPKLDTAAPATTLPPLSVRANARWLGAGFLLAMGSSFGQTYFIALFGADIRQAYGLSHGDFGGLYTIATTASAITLIYLGKLADHVPFRTLSAAAAIALGVGCLVMSVANSIVVLVIAL
ncbi:MAG: hypothetical protein AAFZ05_01485 [Pseudomonadota bacterium]